MSVDLRAAAAQYLSDRRARGHRLADHDWMIAAFLDGLAARGSGTITLADAVAFAIQPAGAQPVWHATRLRAVRGLAAYVHALDPTAAELIPAKLIQAKTIRRPPYLYSSEEVAQLMSAAATLSPPMLASSMHTLIGLLAATGLRSGEAVGLDLADVCLEQRTMTVTGKYGKRRIVPLHPTTVKALVDYQDVRAHRAGPSGPLLIGAKGRRLNPNSARAAFRALAAECQLHARPGCGPPRLHDLRHTFAVNSLIDAHREGADVDARIAVLANYLGHVEPANTYWYLSASPELMAAVCQRMNTPRKYRP